jgi:hypothetical protein
MSRDFHGMSNHPGYNSWRGMTGVYQHCDEKHLHRYLAEFDFRHSNRAKLDIDDLTRAEIALQGVKGKRLTYRTVGA